jgi:hypothetical protein
MIEVLVLSLILGFFAVIIARTPGHKNERAIAKARIRHLKHFIIIVR